MRIGIDFDNTIVNYDGVFHRVALEHGLIPASLPTSKNSVRDYLNASGRNDEFTKLQGYVYGKRMDLVAAYPGVQAFVHAARVAGHDLFIVSHKTRHPILGPRYDMHATALAFLQLQALVGPNAVMPESIFFSEHKEEKVARAAALSLDVFIDDLPEILAMASFPAATRAILFDPDGHHSAGHWQDRTFERHGSWASIHAALLRPS